MKIKTTAEMAAPTAAVTCTSMEKIWFAASSLPSPSFLAIKALPPEPIIKPPEPITMRSGQIRFSAANEFFPTKLDTKKPSTMV